MERTVWIINPPSKGGVDYSSANRYGKIQFLLKAGDSASDAPEIVRTKLEKACEQILDNDYLGWAGGDPWNHFMAGFVLGQMDYPEEFNLLIWERSTTEEPTLTKSGFYIAKPFSRYET